MGKVLNHPLRAMGAALTVVGAAVAFFVLFVPLAAADRIHPGGKGGSSKGSPGTNEAWWYASNDGTQVLHSLSLDEPFSIVGKNLNEVLPPEGNFSIQCWDGHTFIIVSNWEYGPDSRSLVNVDLNNDCVDKQGETSVRVRYRTSQTSKGVQYVALPTVPVKG